MAYPSPAKTGAGMLDVRWAENGFSAQRADRFGIAESQEILGGGGQSPTQCRKAFRATPAYTVLKDLPRVLRNVAQVPL